MSVLPQPMEIIEGSWEDVAQEANRLRGRHVRLYIYPQTDAVTTEPPNDAKGWPAGFFEDTYGSLAKDPLTRLPQGGYEAREALD